MYEINMGGRPAMPAWPASQVLFLQGPGATLNPGGGPPGGVQWKAKIWPAGQAVLARRPPIYVL